MECPDEDCKSAHIVKAGFCINRTGKWQRYKCQECGKTFYKEDKEDNEETKTPAHTT